MFDHEISIPDTAELHAEEAGVQWYIESRGHNKCHYMVFNESVLSASWVGANWIFQTLVSMPVEERARYCSYDEFMTAIKSRMVVSR